jgi:cysteine desulfurase
VLARRAIAARAVHIPVGSDGVVIRDRLVELMSQRRGPALLSLQMANNETGVLQPVADVARQAKEHGLAVHADAVQAAGRCPSICARWASTT